VKELWMRKNNQKPKYSVRIDFFDNFLSQNIIQTVVAGGRPAIKVLYSMSQPVLFVTESVSKHFETMITSQTKTHLNSFKDPVKPFNYQ
jgi:hypothetical protein